MKNGKTPPAVVAGGAGFIGSHLCDRLLERGHYVICIDNLETGRRDNLRHFEGQEHFEFIEADIIDPLPEELNRFRGRIERVFNLACAASPPHYQADPEHTLLTNILGTRNLLRLAEENNARFLQASTSEVYGDPAVHPQTESYWGNVNPTGPRACYDEGKRAAETLVFDYARSGRVAVRVARIFNTYGPRMRADDGRVVSNVVTQALTGRPVTIYGDGEQTRSFCYVDDLVDGLMKLMDHETDSVPGPVNLGNPVELRVSDLVQRVFAVTRSKSEVVRRPLPIDDPRRRRPDISRANTLLDWQPATPLDRGLDLTIAYFRKEIARPQRSEQLRPTEVTSGRTVAANKGAKRPIASAALRS